MTTKLQRLRRLETRADEFEILVAAALKRSIRAGTSKLGAVITAAAEPAEPFVSLDDLAAIGTAWQVEMDTTIMPALQKVVAQGADDAVADMVAATGLVTPPPLSSAEAYLAQAQNRLAGIGSDVWQNTRTELVEGMSQGESIPELSARVRQEIASSRIRATTIARTEVIGASNAGSLAQMRSFGTQGPKSKSWLATNDRATRTSHRTADGQEVPINEPFQVGGVGLDFPGDPTAPAHEVVNCRCTLTWEF